MNSDTVLLGLMGTSAVGLSGITMMWVMSWKGVWRWVSLVPFGLVAVLVLRIVTGVRADPSSHNLWPFELLFGCATALLALAVLGIVHARRMGAQTPQQNRILR